MTDKELKYYMYKITDLCAPTSSPIRYEEILAILREIHDKWANEISKQYLGSFFEDENEKGVFQIIDVIANEGYVIANNGIINIKRKLSEIQLRPDLIRYKSDWIS